MHTIDIIIVIAYLALCILIALYKSKSIKTLKEYALGKNHFPDIVIITTLFATDIGAGSVMGSISKVYTLGMFFIVTRLISPLFWLIMAQIYGRNIDQFYGCISISDIMEKLYGKVGRWMTNIAAIFASIGVVALQATAMGYLVNYFFNISYLYSVIISVLILSIYSAFGGTRAIAMTDVFQFAILMIAIPIACSFAYHDVGGYKGIINGLPNEMLQLDLNKENILLFLSLVFFSFMPETGGTYIHRFLISKNSIQLVKCMRIVALINIPFTLIICLIGLIIGIKAPDINPNTAFVYFVANYMSVGIKGLIVAGLLAVIMSTADSWLNTTSVLVTHDIIRKIIPLTEKQALLIVKISTFLISIFAIILAINEKGIMEICWLTPNIWCPLITVPLSVGFLKFRTTPKAFVTASITGITFAFISGYIVGDLATISLMCGMIGSAVGLFGMHYWQLHQGTLNIHTHINENANVDRKIAVAESKCNINAINMYKDGAENTKTIADKLMEQSFIQGVAEVHIHTAKNLLSQGFDMGIIERATGISRTDLIKLQQDSKKTH